MRPPELEHALDASIDSRRAGGALVACHSPRPIPGSASVAAWQKQFAALDCLEPAPPVRHACDRADALCDGAHLQSRADQTRDFRAAGRAWSRSMRGPMRSERFPITSIYTGGVHSPQRAMWCGIRAARAAKPATRELCGGLYAAQRRAERTAARPHRFADRHRARNRFPQGRRLSSQVAFHNFRKDDRTAKVHTLFLVKDNEPFASAPPVEGIGRGLFCWDPVRRNFVVQKEAHRDRGERARQPLDRSAIDCSGATLALDADWARRLAPIQDENAMYVISPKGDLIVRSQLEGHFCGRNHGVLWRQHKPHQRPGELRGLS